MAKRSKHVDFEELFRKIHESVDPQCIAMKEFKALIKRRDKISPVEFRKHGLIETAKLLEESNRLFHLAYLEAQKEAGLWA
jgi:hypothetical protein